MPPKKKLRTTVPGGEASGAAGGLEDDEPDTLEGDTVHPDADGANDLDVFQEGVPTAPTDLTGHTEAVIISDVEDGRAGATSADGGQVARSGTIVFPGNVARHAAEAARISMPPVPVLPPAAAPRLSASQGGPMRSSSGARLSLSPGRHLPRTPDRQADEGEVMVLDDEAPPASRSGSCATSPSTRPETATAGGGRASMTATAGGSRMSVSSPGGGMSAAAGLTYQHAERCARLKTYRDTLITLSNDITVTLEGWHVPAAEVTGISVLLNRTQFLLATVHGRRYA